MKLKTFFITFKGLSNAKNYLRPESAPINFLREEVYKSMTFFKIILVQIKVEGDPTHHLV